MANKHVSQLLLMQTSIPICFSHFTMATILLYMVGWLAKK